MVWILACGSVWLWSLLGPGVLADGRLPNATIPLHYDLRLEATGLGRNDFTYRGVVSIRLSIASDTDEVVLHNVGSALRSTALRRCRDRVEIGHRVLRPEPDSELLHIRTDRTLRTLEDGAIVLTIAFNNTLGREQKGFYRTQYAGPRRMPMVVATTHFQPCYARLAFPCFDEPALKATFQVTIVTNASYMVASNAPIANVTWLPDGHKVVLFERTVPMQTYLVTFLIANFTSVHARSPSGVEVGVLAPPKDKDWLQFSLQAATVLLTGLERYTGLQGLGVAKLDHAVIPRFGNAMENWGLVSYDEQYLVLKKRAHRLQRAQAVITIGHETAHQLFGNVVGPAWWSYLWLSEGFATYLEVVLGSESYPELVPLEETFAVRHMRRALLEDAVGDRALTVEPLPADTDQIETLFDTITYSKAACILRMINCSIGEENFQRGVRIYLTGHWNGVVRPVDLYESFSLQVEEEPTVEQMFRSWSDKPGHPVVTVERLNASYVRFRQERYQEELTAPDTDSRWYIPITYFSNSSRGKYEYRPAFWMKESDRVVEVALELNGEDVLVVNPRQVGFYRVEYDARGWECIVDVLTLLPAVVQAKLIDDAFVFARAGRLGYETTFELLRELLENPHPVPWLVAMAEENIGFLQRVLQSDEFNRLVAGFAGEMFRFAGNVAQTLLQSPTLDQAFGWLGRLGTTEGVGKSRSIRDTTSKAACGVPSVDEMVQTLVALLDNPLLERERRLFALLECPSNPAQTIPLLVAALERMQATKRLTPARQYALLERLIKSDPARLLPPVVHFLSGGEEVISTTPGLQRLLTLIIHEVSDRGQAEAVRKLITEYSASLSEDFLRRANITLTSTISWHTEQVPKLRALLNDSRLGAPRYGQRDTL